MTILQIALDFVDLERALKVAKEVAGSADWLEAGTPLIKANGMDAVRRLKKAFPDKTIVADLKIADTGDIETEMAAKAGADIVTVLASSDDQTITQAAEAAKRYGCKILVDLLNSGDVAARAKRAEELGADYVMVHTGIDQQMVGKDVFSDLRRVVGAVKIPIAVGGGLTPENVKKAALGGAEIIIIGGAVTKAPDARGAAVRFKKIIRSIKSGKAGGGSGKASKAAKKATAGKGIEAILAEVSTPNVSDAMHHGGEMHGMHAISLNGKFCGKAFTVKAYPGDWSKTVQAIDAAERGDVIVIDAHGSRVALWGELATRSAISRGIKGLVIDGGVRDVEEIRKLKFPVFARCVSPAAGEPKGMGEMDVAINCGGAQVEPGDYILADESGVVVIPRKRALEIANRALYVKEKEDRVRKEIKDGKTLGKILELDKWDKI